MSRLPTAPRVRTAILVAGGTALALYLLALMGSFVDGSYAGDDIGRNIALAGQPMSGQSTDELGGVLEALDDAYGSTRVEIDAGFGPVRSQADELGLGYDTERSIERLREANQPVFALRPILWVGSFFGTRDINPAFEVDDSQVRSALLDLDLPGITEWKPPSIDADASGVRLVSGTPGSGIDVDHFSTELRRAAEEAGGDNPLVVTPRLVDVDPPISEEAAAAVARDAELATASPVEVTAGSTARSIEVAMLRSWLVLAVDGDEVDWDIDHSQATADLAELMSGAGDPGREVRFVVEAGQVSIDPGTEQTVCCADDSSRRILDALRSGADEVALALDTAEMARGLEWANSLGIVEEVASFTSNHACCQNRVVNIHLIADATRGVIIEPGSTFSLNGHVGRRTEEKGYLPAGGISSGVLVDQLGGGISQFTTALFNAAFFAGLDFGEYQAHSIYFSRYPYGREATLSFPAPDLQIRNTSPYGVLIWPTYTDTSITVTLYSTRHLTAEQTDQTTSPQGECTRVRTERTRTYFDGRVKVDSVGALYRPGEGLTCSGESSVPTTTPTTTEPPPTTTTTEPPPPPPPAAPPPPAVEGG